MYLRRMRIGGKGADYEKETDFDGFTGGDGGGSRGLRRVLCG